MDSRRNRKRIYYSQAIQEVFSKTSYEEFHAKLIPKDVLPQSMLWYAAPFPYNPVPHKQQNQPYICTVLLSTQNISALCNYYHFSWSLYTKCCRLIEKHLCNKIRWECKDKTTNKEHFFNLYKDFVIYCKRWREQMVFSLELGNAISQRLIFSFFSTFSGRSNSDYLQLIHFVCSS